MDWVFLVEKGGRQLSLPAGAKQIVRGALPGALGNKLWYGLVMPRAAKQCDAAVVMTGGAVSLKRPVCHWKLTDKGLIFSFNGRDARVPLAPDEGVQPMEMEKREKLKTTIADGREYFFADVTGAGASKVMSLLKAFSLFKKRQRSNMKLVLAGAGAIDKLDSYKYREDVCLYPERTSGQMEAAYAVIRLPRKDELGISILNAWRARVPVIMVGKLPKTFQEEAIIQVGPDDNASLADALKTLYKDEGRRNELIEKGVLGVAGLGIRQSAAVIEDLVRKI
ncbi:MAG TPA: glycosyltransferase [Puia sp.]